MDNDVVCVDGNEWLCCSWFARVHVWYVASIFVSMSTLSRWIVRIQIVSRLWKIRKIELIWDWWA